MSGTHGKKRKSHQSSGQDRARQTHRARTVYLGALIVWCFVMLLLMISIDPDLVPWIGAGLVTWFFVYVTMCTWLVKQGKPIATWKKGLVIVPWRLAGGGDKPLDAATHTPAGARALLFSAIGTVIIGVGLFFAVWYLL